MTIVVYGLNPGLARRLPGVTVANQDKAVPGGADVLILAANFIPHSDQTDAFLKYRRDQVKIVHGGISAIRRVIASLKQNLSARH